MRGFSRAILAGNLTRDPELRTTPNGHPVCSFAVAVNRVWKDANGDLQESASFIDCTAWGKLGETINDYAKKGSAVLVSGRLEQRSWEEKDTGKKRSRVEVVVDEFNFAGGRSGEGTAKKGTSTSKSSSAAAQQEEPAPEDIPEDIDLSEIPF